MECHVEDNGARETKKATPALVELGELYEALAGRQTKRPPRGCYSGPESTSQERAIHSKKANNNEH